jgi:transcriptional regulator with XRE-family HTH domain
MAKSKHPAEDASIGFRLKRARHEAKISQMEVARRAGIDVAVVSRLERGLHSPTINTLGKMARAVGVPIGKLLP